MAMRVCSMRNLLPFMGMILVILCQVTSMVVNKLAMTKGSNKDVLRVYTTALSCIIVLPCWLMFPRTNRSPLTLPILFKFLLSSFIRLFGSIFGYAGILYGSPMLGTAMLNLVPVFTFILAVIFRMEKLSWKSTTSLVKTLGTVVSIAGAFVVTFYKGPRILHASLLTVVTGLQGLVSAKSSWIFGAILLAGDALMTSLWYILQASILKKFKDVLTIMFFLFFFTTILSTIYAFIVVEDAKDWQVKLDIGLVAIVYSAVFSSAFRVTLCTWCLSKTGPLYVSMFKPLSIIVAVAMDFIFLGEALGIGSLIGAIIIVAGFYSVLWGKAKEEECKNDESVVVLENSWASSEEVPLLQNKVEGR